jgi:glycosyltransferase involved in cell wall biosynthesis
MRIGIDASNLRLGGGVTHLVEILRSGDPSVHGIEEVLVWAGAETHAKLEPKPWLRSVHEPMLDRALPFRLYWQGVVLPRLARKHCDLLFVPGGRSGRAFRPVVTMSRNLLPFEIGESNRYGISRMRGKFLLLRLAQTRSFRQADGVIFLNENARQVVMSWVEYLHGNWTIIPHGVSHQFLHPPRKQEPLVNYSVEQPLRLLYVSVIDLYKHQWNVVEGVSKLRHSGLPIHLDLVGSAYPPALKRLRNAMDTLDPSGEFIHYHGHVPYTQLPSFYHRADVFVFASSCENMPNILLEAMAAGLPIACSDRGPMPALLGDAGEYFDPEKPTEIARALQQLVENSERREQFAGLAFRRSQEYSWERCAQQTFAFLASVVNDVQPNNDLQVN